MSHRVTFSFASGGDRYTGLDRFGRVDDQYWFNSSGGTVARYQYSYDQDSNVLTRDDLVNSQASQSYGYDSLDRLVGFNITGGTTSVPSDSESWSLDSLGNTTSYTVNGAPVTTATNDQNELTAYNSSSANQTFDNNGNTLNTSSGTVLDYDAWNHIHAETVGGTTVTYGYDALGQRITSNASNGSVVHSEIMLYSASGQVLETDTSDDLGSDETGSAVGPPLTAPVVNQYVWGLGYVNDLVERDDQFSSYTTPTRTIYSVRDANHNVTAITSSSGGSVLEWFGYGAYGTRWVYDSSYASTTDGYYWQIGFQGGYTDPYTGLVHFEARDMDPVTGRWLEGEPFGSAYVDGENLEQFADGAPIDATDATGLDPSVIIHHDPILTTKDDTSTTTSDFLWGTRGLDAEKDYAQVNLIQIHKYVNNQEVSSEQFITIDSLKKRIPRPVAPKNYKEFKDSIKPFEKGDTVDLQLHPASCPKDVTRIVVETWIWIEEIKLQGPDPGKDGFGSLVSPDGKKRITANKAPGGGAQAGGASATYLGSVADFEYTFVWESDKGVYEYFHGDAFNNGQPSFDNNASKGINQNIPDPDPGITEGKIKDQLPAK